MKKLTALFAFVFPMAALAWGPVGHRTVALIAETSLTPNTRAGIQRILGRETLADVANWADAIKSSGHYGQTTWYHFEKIADGIPYLENLRRLPEEMKRKGGLIEALLIAMKETRDPSTPPAARAEALKFIIHFVGDLHQPLHTGKPDDNGGNKIPITWFGTETSLHGVWDSQMLFTGHGDILDPKQSPTVNSVNYARFLFSARRPPVATTLDLERWLNESLMLRPRAYDPRSATDQPAYQAANLGLIDQRIFEAGFRLSAMLNGIFAREPALPMETNLWRDIKAIVPLVEQWISLRP